MLKLIARLTNKYGGACQKAFENFGNHSTEPTRQLYTITQRTPQKPQRAHQNWLDPRPRGDQPRKPVLPRGDSGGFKLYASTGSPFDSLAYSSSPPTSPTAEEQEIAL